MSISIRLDKSVEESLRRRLQADGGSLSDFIRDAIREKLSSYDAKPTPYALGEHLFGRYSSGRDDLSTNRKAILREKLNAKYRR
ncbi:MAG: ribbon-helix-helix protein, CopG family [Thiothrix sp.]|jgi:Arc/MetJ-type ribon-helix-helix transcriptional regulator|uniref:ribbon-helix-helix protein, CopG family n=1 Tax=Thiothrix sp. TaxID=1032 RepID=UPI002617D74D|nr:ribbon-helix-helix protein, CopG family [Thiothrix sp.]MDD5394408.1 ribbon-helix-helix protein, CopG family [Thiothrix sp.]